MANRLEFEATLNNAGFKAGVVEMERLQTAASARMAAAVKADQLATLTNVARSGGLSSDIFGGAHGVTGISGIVGELMVLAREMGRGNFSRVPGSLTIFFQRLGLLGKVFRSTAADAIFLAEAENKLLVRMAAAARVAEFKAAAARAEAVANGVATEADMARVAALEAEATALRQAAIAQKAKTELAIEGAEIEKATAQVGITSFGKITIALVLLTVAAYLVWRHLKNLNEEMDRTAAEAGKGFGDRMKTNEEAMKKAAESAADFASWLKKLGDSYEDLNSVTDRQLELLREEFRLRQEIAGLNGQSKGAGLAAEQEEREKELAIIKASLKAQEERAKQSKQAAIAAESAAFTGSDAVARQAKLLDIPKEQSDFDKEIERLTALKKQLEDIVEERRQAYNEAVANNSPMAVRNALAGSLKSAPETNFSVGPKGEETQENLNNITETLQKAMAARNNLTQQEIELTNVQRALTDALEDAKKRGEKDNEAVDALTKKRDELAAQIELHKKYDAQLAQASKEKPLGASSAIGRSDDSLARVGNFLGSARGGIESLANEQVKLAREANRHLAQISNNTQHRQKNTGADHYGTN